MILSEVYIIEYTDADRKAVADARRAERKNEEELLMQIQLMSYNTLIEDILKRIPIAKWTAFKKADNYRGKISYETNGGIAELWFRTDGMVVCSTTDDPRKVKCCSDEKIDAWIAQHPPVEKETDDIPLTGDMIKEISNKITLVFVSEPLQTFKKQVKVVGKQSVFHKGQRDYFDLWYRPNGEVFCKTPDGRFFSFKTLKTLERFIRANCLQRKKQ